VGYDFVFFLSTYTHIQPTYIDYSSTFCLGRVMYDGKWWYDRASGGAVCRSVDRYQGMYSYSNSVE